MLTLVKRFILGCSHSDRKKIIIWLNNRTLKTVDPQNDNLTLASLVVIKKRTENIKIYRPFAFSLSKKEKRKKRGCV